MPNNHLVSTIVARKRLLTERVHLLELSDIEEWKLPPFTPGAHVDVHLPSGAIRQYSLCSDPSIANRYQIAVLRDPNCGSKEVADCLKEGDEVSLSLPRNLFPLDLSANKTILIAGGIGITPMMSMIPTLLREGRPFLLHYCSRSIDDTPFSEQLLPLAKQGKVILHHDNGDPDRGLKFDQLVAAQTSDSHYYGCGPAGFLDAYLNATSHLQEQFVHFERFTAPKNIFQAAFTLKLQKSNRSIEVGKGESIVDALEREGVKVMTGCLAGACGLCRVPYLSGDVVHRDFRLTGEDRKRELTACVSGCNSAELVLDL